MNGDGYSPEVIALAAEMLQKHLDLIAPAKRPRAKRKAKKKTAPKPVAKKEILHQQERSARSALKRKAAGEVELRLRASSGTKIALNELMAWSELEEQGEALTLAIHHLHGKGARFVVQTLEYQLTIGETPRPECIRLRARPGTIQALQDLMEWAGIDERGHFVEVMISRLHQIGKEDAIPLLTPPRHEITVSEKVAARLRRVGLEESLLLELDE